MKIVRLIFLALFAVASIGAQNPFRQGEFTTTRNPNFSPDGKYIVFASFVEQKKPNSVNSNEVSGGIRVMNADGSGMRDVTPKKDGIYDFKPSVSYDNSKIAFLRRIGTGPKATVDVFVINFDGTGLKRITNTVDREEAHPAFTADGKEVVYVRFYMLSLVDPQQTGELLGYDLQTATEKVLIGKEYRVAQAIPTVRPGGFFIIGAALDAAGKPVPPRSDGTFANLLGMAIPSAASARGLPPVRAYSGFKLPADEDPFIQSVSVAKDSGAVLVTVRYGSNYYLVTRSGTEQIGKLDEAVMNISADGTKLIKGSREDHLKVYDIGKKSWTKLAGKP